MKSLRFLTSGTFVRFCVVGAIGTGVNLATYAVLTILFHAGALASSCAAFMVAVTGNYCLNAIWTFGKPSSPPRLGLRQFASYVAANALGLAVNLAVLTVTLTVAGHVYHIAGQVLGIVCGMVFNFLVAKYLVFKTKQSVQEVR